MWEQGAGRWAPSAALFFYSFEEERTWDSVERVSVLVLGSQSLRGCLRLTWFA